MPLPPSTPSETTSDAGMAQGAHRYERFQSYRAYVTKYQDTRWAKNATFQEVVGVGHSSSKMLASVEARQVMFEQVAHGLASRDMHAKAERHDRSAASIEGLTNRKRPNFSPLSTRHPHTTPRIDRSPRQIYRLTKATKQLPIYPTGRTRCRAVGSRR